MSINHWHRKLFKTLHNTNNYHCCYPTLLRNESTKWNGMQKFFVLEFSIDNPNLLHFNVGDLFCKDHFMMRKKRGIYNSPAARNFVIMVFIKNLDGNCGKFENYDLSVYRKYIKLYSRTSVLQDVPRSVYEMSLVVIFNWWCSWTLQL